MSRARDILARKSPDVTTIDHNATVREAAVAMNAHHIGSLIVTDGEKAIGIFTERDILRRVVAADRDPNATRVGEVMTTPVACCRRDTLLSECRGIMTQKRIRHLPVVEEGRLLGMLSSGDVLAHEVHDQQTTIEYFAEYIYGRT